MIASSLVPNNMYEMMELMIGGPSIMELLFNLIIAILCMGAVWLSSLTKPVRREGAHLYWILGAVLELLHAFLPLLIGNFALPAVPLLLVIYRLRPLVRLFILSLAEFFLLRKQAVQKKHLIGALALQIFLTLIIEWLGATLLLLF